MTEHREEQGVSETKATRNGQAGFGWIDAHIHLDHYELPKCQSMLEEAYQAGCEGVVAVSQNLASCEKLRSIAAQHKGRVVPAYGFHPEQPAPDEADADELFEWIRNRYAEGEEFAIGEVGLPYFTRTNAEKAGQPFDESGHLRLLDRFAALAAELDRPIALHVIHEDGRKVCDLLERHGVRRAHFHYFKGDRPTIERMIANRYYVSITPEVLYDEQSRELVRLYPIELMMTETDGPWPFEGPFQGVETTPLLVPPVVREIAMLKGIEAREAAAVLAGNAKYVYDFVIESESFRGNGA